MKYDTMRRISMKRINRRNSFRFLFSRVSTGDGRYAMINDLVTEHEFHFSERWVLFEVSVVLNDLLAI